MKTTVFALAMILSVDVAFAQTAQPQQRDPRRTNGTESGQRTRPGVVAPAPGGQTPAPVQNAESEKYEVLLALLTPDQVRTLWSGKEQGREPSMKFKKLAEVYKEIGKGSSQDEYIQAITKTVIIETPGSSAVLTQRNLINTYKRFQEDSNLFASAELGDEKFEILLGVINRYTEMIKPKSVGPAASTPGEATLREALKYVLKNVTNNDEAKLNALIEELETKQALFSLRAPVAPRQIGEGLRNDGFNRNTGSRGNI